MKKPNMWSLIGIALLVIIGGIHLIDAPDSFGDAPYKGVLFVLNGVGALLASGLILRNRNTAGWWLGMAVAAGAIVGYVISRTVGLPGLEAEPDAWFETMGITSVICEVAFIAIGAWMTLQQPAAKISNRIPGNTPLNNQR